MMPFLLVTFCSAYFCSLIKGEISGENLYMKSYLSKIVKFYLQFLLKLNFKILVAKSKEKDTTF